MDLQTSEPAKPKLRYLEPELQHGTKPYSYYLQTRVAVTEYVFQHHATLLHLGISQQTSLREL